ncbi:MAG: phage scaffolding protein [Methanocorpusculum sp.]|nr:phage scaffolding protein [Methanocorpusculum sp.]
MNFSHDELKAQGFSDKQIDFLENLPASASAPTGTPAVIPLPAVSAAPSNEVSLVEFNQMKAAIAQLQQDNAALTSSKKSLENIVKQQRTEMRNAEFRHTVDDRLRAMGVRDPVVARMMMDQSKVTIDSNGTIAGFEEEAERVISQYPYFLTDEALAARMQQQMMQQQMAAQQESAAPQQQPQVPQNAVPAAVQPPAATLPPDGRVISAYLHQQQSAGGQALPPVFSRALYQPPAQNPMPVQSPYTRPTTPPYQVPNGFTPAAASPAAVPHKFEVTSLGQAGRIMQTAGRGW